MRPNDLSQWRVSLWCGDEHHWVIQSDSHNPLLKNGVENLMILKIINYKSISEDGKIDLSPVPFIPKMWDPFTEPLELEGTKKRRAPWAISAVLAFLCKPITHFNPAVPTLRKYAVDHREKFKELRYKWHWPLRERSLGSSSSQNPGENVKPY